MNRFTLFRDEFVVEFLSKYNIPPEITKKYILNNLSTQICICKNLNDSCQNRIVQTCLNCSKYPTYYTDNNYYSHYCLKCLCTKCYCWEGNWCL